jgi:hypothetical protein
MYSEMSQPTYVCFPRRRRRSETNLKIVLEQELSRQVAEAVTELLQVLCCGEESAVFAFSSLSRNPTLNANASSCAAMIAREEAFHDQLLRGLRNVLPKPRADLALIGKLKEFYRSLNTPDLFVHLTQICALDSAVCLILSAVRECGRPIGNNVTLNAIFSRIQRDEVGHVRASGRLTRELGSGRVAADCFVRTREKLAGVILERADALETLHVDPAVLTRNLFQGGPRSLLRQC